MNQSDNYSSGTKNANSTKDELKQDASKLKNKAESQASAKTKEASQKATAAAHSTSSALREAGDKLESDSDAPNWLGSAFKQAADSVADLADTVEGKEPREMMRDVSRFARDNPAAFLAGSAIAGFAAARVMKAGAEQSDASLSDIDPASNSSSGSTRYAATSAGGVATRSTPIAPTTTRTSTVRGS